MDQSIAKGHAIVQQKQTALREVDPRAWLSKKLDEPLARRAPYGPHVSSNPSFS